MGLKEALFDKGYKLYMDNYYTSVPLLEDLERHGILAYGTVQSNRKGLPRDTTDVHNEQIKGLKQGESVYLQNDTITYVGWKDSKMVYMLATTLVNPACNSHMERSVKLGNKRQKAAVNQPSVIFYYNQNMGGVELSAQRVTSYACLMKGAVWHYKMFFYLLEHFKCPNLYS